MSASFLLFYPLGAIIVRLGLSMKVHISVQLFTLAMSIAGVGIGIKLANLSQTSISGNAHTVIGLVVVSALLALQPLRGWLQHRYYKQTGGRRGLYGFTHIWFGRSMIALGIVNGGLGLALAGDQGIPSRTIPYIIVAAVMGAVYIGILVWDVVRTKGRSERVVGLRVKEFDVSKGDYRVREVEE